MEFDLIVIGSGPGGYVAAIRAAQLGLKVACVEKEATLGGTCLNVGCIPSKALLHTSEYYDQINHHGKEYGITCRELSYNWPQMLLRKEDIVDKLTKGISFLFKKNGVATFQGAASFRTSHQIAVKGKEEVLLEGKNILIATGSEPFALPFLPFDEKVVLSSTGALALKEVPKKMVVVGAGVIGLELGSVYRRLGTEVVVVELLESVCPTLDHDLSKALFKIFKEQGFEFHLGTEVVQGEKKGAGISLKIRKGGKEEAIQADVCLVAIGRKPYTKDLSVEAAGVQLDDKGRVVIDGQFRTKAPHIYAIGDVVDGPMLAHKASEEGIAVVEFLAGKSEAIDYQTIPNVMYTSPEVAAVGFSEKEAKSMGREVMVGTFSMKANSRARCTGEGDGLVKVVGDRKTGLLMGMHIISAHASEMIGEGVIAIKKRMTVEELAHAAHAHPTFTEAIKEAAMGALGHFIHS